MTKEKNPDIFVINRNQEKAFKLIRENGVLQAEIKTRSRDRNIPLYIYVDAIGIIDQVVAVMNQEERLIAYNKLLSRLQKVE